MRKLLLSSVSCLLLLMLMAVPLSAQEDEPPPEAEPAAEEETSEFQPDLPLYAVGYGVGGGEFRVATFIAEGYWTQNSLPARVLFGEVLGELVMPMWSRDGWALYTTIYEPLKENVAVTIGRYNSFDTGFDPVAQPINPDDLGGAEYVRLLSLSPNGRYAVAQSLISTENHLLNLETGAIIASPLECPAYPLSWGVDFVLLSCTGAFYSEPNIFALDLNNGRELFSLSPPSLSANPFDNIVKSAQNLDPARLIVGSFGASPASPIGILSLEAPRQADYYEMGRLISLSPEGDMLSYFDNAGNLKRLSLNDPDAIPRIISSNPASTSEIWQADGSLAFWRTRQNGLNLQIIRTTATPHERVERIIYDGLNPSRTLFAPQGEIFALEFQRGFSASYVEIYKGADLIWVSDATYPESYTSFQSPVNDPIAWSADGEWLHLDFRPADSPETITLSVNVLTGQSIPAPEARARYVSASPDNRWWLYTLNENPERGTIDRLIAYDRVAGRVEELSIHVPLYSNFLFPDWMYYIWSPMLQ